jgi:hypothetical protein
LLKPAAMCWRSKVLTLPPGLTATLSWRTPEHPPRPPFANRTRRPPRQQKSPRGGKRILVNAHPGDRSASPP